MFTKKEVNALLDFLDRVDVYDYIDEFDGLETAMDKIYEAMETDREKPW